MRCGTALSSGVVGRNELPVDPGAGVVQEFAHALRGLRGEAGGPSYRAPARRYPASCRPTCPASPGGMTNSPRCTPSPPGRRVPPGCPGW
jgi:hypothetical protein